MDFVLRCNSLKCRVQLTGYASVTTCSHIFCENCTEMLGLGAAHAGSRVCPACQSNLPNPDDAVTTYLNPSEDYKTSVLSGLNPAVIMECAGRGLAFWCYQSTQEIVYQEHLAKNLTDKYNGSKMEIDQLANDANAQIDMLTQKLNDVTIEGQRWKTEAEALSVNLRDRTRRHQQTQELYDRLKRKQMTAATQMAAQSAIDETIKDLHWNAMNNHGRNSDGSDNNENHRSRLQRPEPSFHQSTGANMAPTPHRTRLGSNNVSGSSRLRNVTNSNSTLRQGIPRSRQPLNHISPNASRLNGLGMRAGIKSASPNGLGSGNGNQAPVRGGPLRRSPRLAGFTHQGQDNSTSFF